ncbi:hypothetical protein CEXT_586871 [Caerostris extrusa]|uniref:Craniofacial development protein 2-like n=1 Tax=Caerostris extrusa TaxID=172846 RepID=A0AAV4P0D6_CAEEX|nr:hypothetical protein CEXT_586871 [Caerostris extrusa]
MRRRESPREPLRRKESMPKPKQMLQVGTWNVRTMYQIGKTRQLTNEMRSNDRHEGEVALILNEKEQLDWMGISQ